jgi:excisionase family DNA binding protein
MLTTETLADELNVDRTTVTKWVREGRIPAVLLPRHWAIPPEVLDSIRQHGVPPRNSYPRPTLHRERTAYGEAGRC